MPMRRRLCQFVIFSIELLGGKGFQARLFLCASLEKPCNAVVERVERLFFMRSLEQCILYRETGEDGLLRRLSSLMQSYPQGEVRNPTTEETSAFFSFLNAFTEEVARHGLEGNMWQSYLTLFLVTEENAFSRGCEISGNMGGSLHELALLDMALFQEAFAYPFGKLSDAFLPGLSSVVTAYQCEKEAGRVFSRRITERILTLREELAAASSPEAFLDSLVRFYAEYGVGKMGLHKAFRLDKGRDGELIISPITKTAHVQLDDLVGYELAKKRLIDNTEAFVAGRAANNCLLFGDAGTGKSSSIKGILNRYYGQGLRIIEVYKHQFQDLNEVIARIKGRNYRFIIYMDDLSFEDFEIEYKYLKAVIEGGLERKPDNILIYATSNRRHLIRERVGDKLERGDEEDLHSSDTVQEKLSLAYRFGERIYFGSPDKKEFQNIVRVLAERAGITMEEKELFALAGQWELSHGGMTGRTAQQFVDYLLGVRMD